MARINDLAAGIVLCTEMLDAAVMADIPRALNTTFDGVVRDHEVRVLRTAYRITGNWADAEDVAQETFIRLHRHGLQFPNAAALASWLYRVTVNLCLDRGRAHRPSEAMSDLPSASMSAEAELIRRQQQEQLMQAMAQLPTKERAAVVLREIEGLSTAEVAEILGSTEGTVRSQVAKAVARLRSIMSGEER